MSTEKLRGLIRDAILATAAEGRVVIGAHAASFALAGRDDVLRVLVTASTDVRGRLASPRRTGSTKRRPPGSSKSRTRDGVRTSTSFYGVSRELPTHYDLVVNTDRLAPAAVVETIARAAADGGPANSLEIGRKTS